ncbi:hypothetical protein CBF34_03730 [Vagococcus penaei]|uniref:Gram-positive cocci surface proteins LPxTG domain-containing protein n=1 Tax=Vagococcus penaei TaxID=633807 RepID=A0A1Q2D8B9_9ENTE|nr:S8 family serine peptidase [Vagococcus penaei]AQP54649.1 hypothetical protein BW732_10825 [Vagococcus penaei]RSU05301.1 hypothetical protein CBF34_03730 [Vagococcus penaei]
MSGQFLKRPSVRKSVVVASSLMLLSTPVLQSSVVLAEKAKEKTSQEKKLGTRKKELQEFLANEQQNNSKELTAAFYQRVDEQLKAKGVITDGGSHTEVDQSQRIRVIIQTDKEAAVKKTVTPDGSQSAVKSIEQATKKVTAAQSDLKKVIEKIAGAKAKRSFGYLVNAFSIDVRLTDLDTIKNLSGVLSVTPAQVFYPSDTDANQLAQVQKVWEENKFKGEGMVVSIIDSGIDPNHPDLYLSEETTGKLTKAKADEMPKGKYFNSKVPYGYNYADGNDDIVDTGDAGMHGQHVAGIAGANGQVKGVAPEAQLLAMKVFSNNKELKGCYSDDVIAAIEDSVKLGADVINMSLGSVSDNTDPNDPQSIAVREATEAGVISIISAGNNNVSGTNDTNADPQNLTGTTELSTVGGPGVTTEALTVASSENTKVTMETIKDTLGNVVFDSVTGLPKGATTVFSQVTTDYSILEKELDLVNVGLGQESDYTSEIKAQLKGKIALIQRGGISFTEKAKRAKDNGAIAAFIYNNQAGVVQMALDDPDYPVLGLSDSDGQKLVDIAAKKQAIHLDFDSASVDNDQFGKMSSFSSWGPTPELNFKPEISAPGGNIYSLANGKKYQSMSGTSMAAPFVAGSQALLLQSIKEKKLDLSGAELVKFAKDSVINTSVPMFDSEHTKEIISPRRQGAGQINIAAAINNQVSVTSANDQASTVALKEIGRSTTFTVNVKNNGQQEKTYHFNDYGGVYTQQTADNKEIYDTKIPNATIKADKNQVTVAPGQTEPVTLTITLPFAFDAQQFVEGYVGFDGDSKETPNLVIPYMGFFGKYSQGKIIDPLHFQEGHQAPTNSGYLISNEKIILGLDGNKVNPDKIAISPKNRDKVKDYSLPILFFNKNYAEATYSIIDEKEQTVRELFISKNGRKDYFSSSTGDWTQHTVSQARWDGKVHDKKTGKEKDVPDGRYQYKISVVAQTDNMAQTTYIPVTVDNTAPKVNQVELAKDGKLVLDVSDNLTGIDAKTVAVAINGKIIKQRIQKVADGQEHAGKYVTDSLTPYLASGRNQVELLVADEAGNNTYQALKVDAGQVENLLVYNVAKGQTITQTTAGYNAEEGTFTLSGSYKESTEFFINGQAVSTNEDGFFETSVPVTNDTVAFKFSNDTTATSVLLDLPVTVRLSGPGLSVDNLGESGVITTEDETYELKGQAKGASVAILYNPTTDEKIPLTLDADGRFTTSVKLGYGDNLFYVVAQDDLTNQTIQKVLIHSSGSTVLNNDIIAFDNIETSLTLLNADSEGYDKDNKILTVTGKLAYPVTTFKLNGEDVAYDPATLEFSYQLKEVKTGSYRLTAYVQDDKLNNARPLVNYGYMIWVDDTLPTLNLENMEVTKDGGLMAYTNQNPYTVKAKILDNLSGFNLSINSNHVHTDPTYYTFDEKFFAKRDAVDVAYKLDVLPEDISKMTATLTDLADNRKTLDFDVAHHLNNVLPAPTMKSSVDTLTKENVVLTASNVADVQKNSGNFVAPVLYYSSDQETWTELPESLNVAENGQLFFKYADKYGNQSPVTSVETKNIRTKVAANPVVKLSSYGEKEEQVTVTLELDKEDKSTKIRYSLDNGKTWKEYNKPFTVNKNSVLQVQSFDTAGNEGTILSENIMVKATKSIDTTDKTKEDTSSQGDSKDKPADKDKPTDKDKTLGEVESPFEENPTNDGKDKPTKDKSDKNATDAKDTESKKPVNTDPIGIIPASSSKLASEKVPASNQSQTKEQGKSGKTLPKTGEKESFTAMTLGSLLVGMAGITLFIRKKKVK